VADSIEDFDPLDSPGDDLNSRLRPELQLPGMGKPVRVDSTGRLLCTAKRRGTDQLCNGLAMRGQRVCRVHGGSAPRAKAKAKLRLAELIDPAIATLAREMTNIATGTPNSRLRAAENVLDRGGLPRRAEVGTEDSRALLLTRLIAMRAEAGGEQAETFVLEEFATDDEDDEG
jgi:hypothetical protein